jgi:protein-disulfide isomerase
MVATTAESQPAKKKRTKKRRPLGDAPVAPAAVATNKWLSTTVLVALLVGLAGGATGGFFLGRSNLWRPARPERPIPGPAYVPIAPWSPRLGPEHAKVTIVEFSDFQCPFCSRAVPTIKQLLADYKDDVAVVFRNKALPFHENARPAALAFQAANRQGKAWELHDKMFENQKSLGRQNLEEYAAGLGLDMTKFRADMDGPEVAKEVDEDDKAADAAEASGTPCFFINGRRIAGAQPVGNFKKVVDEEIKKADDLLAGGTPIAEVYEKLAKAQKSN